MPPAGEVRGNSRQESPSGPGEWRCCRHAKSCTSLGRGKRARRCDSILCFASLQETERGCGSSLL